LFLYLSLYLYLYLYLYITIASQVALQARTLRLMRKIEVAQAKGLGVSLEEENWRARLAQQQRELNKPTQFRVCFFLSFLKRSSFHH
jgi:hypothetical protein